MKAMAVSAFKTHALRALDRVAKTRESLLVTKRGKALVRVVPYRPISPVPVPGKLAEALVFEKDIVSPIGAPLWEANK
jgi:prevent-host-death family protein